MAEIVIRESITDPTTEPAVLEPDWWFRVSSESGGGRFLFCLPHEGRLDLRNPTKGTILVCQDDSQRWTPLPPGLPGQVLTMGEDRKPAWKDPT